MLFLLVFYQLLQLFYDSNYDLNLLNKYLLVTVINIMGKRSCSCFR